MNVSKCYPCQSLHLKQGKSEGFNSCDRPSNCIQIADFSPVWPWNLMDDPKNKKTRLLHQALCIISDPSVNSNWSFSPEQGKSEGFESCDRPIVRKRPIWVKKVDVLYRVTLKFDGWPWKTIRHLFFVVSSFVQHFIAIGEFKLELQSGNTQFGSNSTIFRAVWPWNLTYDLEKE